MDQIVPVSNAPNQTFVAALNVDGTVQDRYLALRYNEIADYWVMTITDASGNVLLDSIPFITGDVPAANLLGQFVYMKLGSAQIINASGVVAPQYPNDTDLGTDFVIIWGNTPTVDANGNVVSGIQTVPISQLRHPVTPQH